MKRGFDLFLNDIIFAITNIELYTKKLNADKFNESKITIDACIRNLEIIGEAVSQLPDELKKKHTEVSWQEIKDFRNVIVHKYYVVDVEILWDIITTKLTPLKEKIKSIIECEKIKS